MRAYADDICMISADLLGDLEEVTEEFEDFAHISGLALNFTKVQVVPLWLEEIESVRRKCGMEHYKWYSAKFDRKAEYLGVFVGPEKGTCSWG